MWTEFTQYYYCCCCCCTEKLIHKNCSSKQAATAVVVGIFKGSSTRRGSSLHIINSPPTAHNKPTNSTPSSRLVSLLQNLSPSSPNQTHLKFYHSLFFFPPPSQVCSYCSVFIISPIYVLEKLANIFFKFLVSGVDEVFVLFFLLSSFGSLSYEKQHKLNYLCLVALGMVYFMLT